MAHYKLREAIAGVSRDVDGHMTIITLPVGAELSIVSATLVSGLVDTMGESDHRGILAGPQSAWRDHSDYGCVRVHPHTFSTTIHCTFSAPPMKSWEKCVQLTC